MCKFWYFIPTTEPIYSSNYYIFKNLQILISSRVLLLSDKILVHYNFLLVFVAKFTWFRSWFFFFSTYVILTQIASSLQKPPVSLYGWEE